MPGIFGSMAKAVLPVTLSGMSKRLTGCPISFHSLGSLRTTLVGISSLAASAATAPYFTWRLLDVWVTTPLAAVHSAGGTPHLLAAAVTNIVRAAAPAWRRYSWLSRIDLLPPVNIS